MEREGLLKMELKSKLVITVLTGALAISGIKLSTQANSPLNNMIRHAALKVQCGSCVIN